MLIKCLKLCYVWNWSLCLWDDSFHESSDYAYSAQVHIVKLFDAS